MFGKMGVGRSPPHREMQMEIVRDMTALVVLVTQRTY